MQQFLKLCEKGKNMRQTLFVIAITLFLCNRTTGHAQNFLQPSASFLQDSGLYQQSILYNLLGNQAVHPLFGVICSGTGYWPEWYLGCDIGEDKLRLTYTKKGIESKIKLKDEKAGRIAKSKVYKRMMDITPEQKSVLDSLFYYSIVTAYVDLEDHMQVFDAVTYTFMSRDMAARAESPREGYSAELVKLVRQLADVVMRKDQETLCQLIPRITDLVDSYRLVYKKKYAITKERRE